jgi:hypothetical protein
MLCESLRSVPSVEFATIAEFTKPTITQSVLNLASLSLEASSKKLSKDGTYPHSTLTSPPSPLPYLNPSSTPNLTVLHFESFRPCNKLAVKIDFIKGQWQMLVNEDVQTQRTLRALCE